MTTKERTMTTTLRCKCGHALTRTTPREGTTIHVCTNPICPNNPKERTMTSSNDLTRGNVGASVIYVASDGTRHDGPESLRDYEIDLRVDAVCHCHVEMTSDGYEAFTPVSTCAAHGTNAPAFWARIDAELGRADA